MKVTVQGLAELQAKTIELEVRMRESVPRTLGEMLLRIERRVAADPSTPPLCDMPRWLAGEARLPPRRVFVDAGLDYWASPLAGEVDWWALRTGWWIPTYGFAIPCVEAVEALRQLGPVLEVGAGTGYWSALLARAGVDVVATDSCTRPYGFSYGAHHPVQRLGAVAAIRRHPARAVLCSWPCYGGRWSVDLAAAIRPGQVLALVGEGDGGCTGAEGMFARLQRDFEEVASIRIPNFPGIHDRLEIYRRRP